MLGFRGGVRAASVIVIQDPGVGLYACGGDVTQRGNSYTITPRDGVRNKSTFVNVGNLTVQVTRAKYTSATVVDDRSSIEVVLQSVSGGAHAPNLSILFLPPGTCTVTVDGVSGSTTVRSDGNPVSIDLPMLREASSTVTIRRD
ncbi:DUF5695 domain-containing protein [Curtobacterium sp. 314Chir4.1]|uniref:DUF5695 domain-containing protein n=1 Tax=Curtobacterium sp. 314Chir4.1 TaxID=1279028 RepID=UPI0011447380|nr:DUF5695 domain-containing protein [Curtobacterium sp. 314Chir4.1]